MQEDLEKNNSILKQFYYLIDFNSLYNKFEELYSEYSECDIINKHLNNIVDYFLDPEKKEEVKLEFNLNSLKNINIEKIISIYNSEKNNSRQLFFSDKNNLISSKNYLFSRLIIIFIIIKYLKQFGELDKAIYEKLNSLITSEFSPKEIENDNNNNNITSANHIFTLYKTISNKFSSKSNDGLINNNNINNNNIMNNINEESNKIPNSNLRRNNSINNQNINNNQNLAYQQEKFVYSIIINNGKDDLGLFLSKFFGKISSKKIDVSDDFKLNSIKEISNEQNPISENLDGSKALIDYYCNELIFIHFNEFLIMCVKQDFNNDIYLSMIHLKILIGYFIWKSLAIVKKIYNFLIEKKTKRI